MRETTVRINQQDSDVYEFVLHKLITKNLIIAKENCIFRKHLGAFISISTVLLAL